MVNFSIVGRNATQEQREQYVKYDKLHNERTYIAELFNREFDYLEARPGGDTGIDIAPIGADKSQILKDFDENNFIHFFGDRMDAGGNDEPLARAIKRGQTYHVKSWKDTQDKLKNLNKV
jgi:phosphomannomutase